MGGKAFEGVTRRVTRDEVKGTVTWLGSQWPDYKLNKGLNLHDSMLGSAGKNDTSGDIDLNLDITAYDQDLVADQLKKLLGDEYVKPRPGNNQIFTAVPICGDPVNGYVQVDFMFGDYEWQKFSYFSPALDPNVKQSRYYWRIDTDNSALKGLYRTELIKALVAYNSDWVLEEDGEMVARVGPTFFHDKGCVWRYRHRPMRKDGKGRVKELKELSREEFMEIYPSATPARIDVLNDPLLVAQMILGPHHQVEALNNFESIWLNLINYYNATEQKLITKIYLERLNSLKAEIPKDIFANYGLKV